jgi:hypothetical protein
MQLLQQRDKVTFLYDYDLQVRDVRMNQPHPAQVTLSWYGIPWAIMKGTRW